VSDLTSEEQKNVRAALRFLRVRCGGANALAKVLRIDRKTLNAPPSPTTVFRVARFAGVSVDDVLTGRFPRAGTCPHCGACDERTASTR
jgi:hypothetical protein